jgi:photosystem II stability/assembly factor-like uncharacterized protein
MKKTITLLFILVSIPFYGQWWTPQNSGTNANFYDVFGINGNTVVVVGMGGTIVKTIDGGAHWVQKPSGTFSSLMKVQFVTANTGFAVGENGTLLKSIDGGENWSSIPTGVTTNLFGLSCLNENVFYISGDNGLIKKTTDGGATFNDQNYAGTYSFRTLQFLNDQVGYASSHDNFSSTDNIVFIKTTDGGNTWILLSNDVTSFHFLNENIGFVISNNTIYKTINGGTDLQFIGGSIGTIADLFSMDENVVWSVDNTYTLCGCSTFCIVKSELTNSSEIQEAHNCYPDTTNPPFTAITFTDTTNGYVVGENGLIYKNSTGTMQNLGITEFDQRNNITITPNPSSESITIINKNSTPINSITITDINGRNAIEISTGAIKVDISSLSKGVYLVQLASDEGITTKKLIKK